MSMTALVSFGTLGFGPTLSNQSCLSISILQARIVTKFESKLDFVLGEVKRSPRRFYVHEEACRSSVNGRSGAKDKLILVSLVISRVFLSVKFESFDVNRRLLEVVG